jgi:uncharacterized membrane protein
MPDSSGAATAPVRRNVLAGALIGIGVAAFLDEVVFHQLLHWHHFYDKSTLSVGLASDGLFHAGGWLAIVAGLFLYADVQRRRWTSRIHLWGAGLVAWGGFQLYDGLVQHKLLGLHQIRYDVDLLPYDLAWNIVGGISVAAGAAVLMRARGRGPVLAEARAGRR